MSIAPIRVETKQKEEGRWKEIREDTGNMERLALPNAIPVQKKSKSKRCGPSPAPPSSGQRVAARVNDVGV